MKTIAWERILLDTPFHIKQGHHIEPFIMSFRVSMLASTQKFGIQAFHYNGICKWLVAQGYWWNHDALQLYFSVLKLL